MKYFLPLLSSLFLLVPLAIAQERVISLTSLEWPPYSGRNVPNQGITVEITRQALKARGYTLDVQFYPWKRAVAVARADKNILGYFPEYHDPSLEKKCLFSDPMGTSPLGILEHVETPVAWETLGDLLPYVIGTVDGYINTSDFDALAAAGAIETEPVVDDKTNIRKVAMGRIPLAVIDVQVFNHLVSSVPSLAHLKDEVRINPHLLGHKELYICFRPSPEGRAAADIFNKGLRHVDINAITSTNMRN